MEGTYQLISAPVLLNWGSGTGNAPVQAPYLRFPTEPALRCHGFHLIPPRLPAACLT